MKKRTARNVMFQFVSAFSRTNFLNASCLNANSLIAISMILVSVNVSADPWIDDWMGGKAATTTSSGAGHYQGSQRGFATGGSFSARWPMTTEYPITITPPKISAGCGGIDIYMGGISYLDPEYLMNKLQGVLTAAPFVAFDMALKTMCESCAETMKSVEQMMNYINGLNLNECALSKTLVTSIVEKDDPSVMSQMWNEVSQGQTLDLGGAKNPTDYASQRESSTGNSPTDLKNAVADCPTKFREIFATGSLVKNVADKAGLTAYAEFIRGYVGDVTISYNTTAKMYNFEEIEVCPKNKSMDLDAFVFGRIQKRNISDNKCVSDGGTALITHTENRLKGILSGYKNGTTLTAPEVAFLNEVPLPIDFMLRRSLLTGADDSAVAVWKEPVAFLYAGSVLQDLLTRTSSMLNIAKRAAKQPGVKTGGDPENCKREVVAPAIKFVENLDERLWDMKREVNRMSAEKKVEIITNAELALSEFQQLHDQRSNVKKNVLAR